MGRFKLFEEFVPGSTKMRELGCIMLSVPMRMDALSVAIDPADLFEPDNEDHGIPKNPHVTILYGLYDQMIPDRTVEQIMLGVKPIVIKFGLTSVFENPDYDVVNISIISPDLHELNARLTELPHDSTYYPTYKPHLTLAYVKKGCGKKYAGIDTGVDWDMTICDCLYSKSDGQKNYYKLNG